MANNLKKDYSKNLDSQQMNTKATFSTNFDDDDDDQDIYISERSSISSSNDINPIHNSSVKRVPTPTPMSNSLLSLVQKQSYNIRYPNSELPDNVMPSISHYKLLRKEEKKKGKPLHKVTPGQGALAPRSETKSTDLNDDCFTYRSYYKIKNPDWTMHQRQVSDAQLLNNESFDSFQYAQQPVLMTTPIKPKQQSRKPRANGVSTMRSNHEKQRYDHSEKNSPTSSQVTFLDNHENYPHYHSHHPIQQQQHVSLENCDNEEYVEQLPKRAPPVQRRKLKIDQDSKDHYTSIHPSKSPQSSNSLMITSNSLTNRLKNRSKIPERSSITVDSDENQKQRSVKPSNHSPPHYHQSFVQSHNSPSIPSQQNYQHHQHLHIRRRPPSGSHVTSDLSVPDSLVRRSDKPTYFQQSRDSFHAPTPTIHNQNSYLPPIIRDHHHQKFNTTRFPPEYYGTIARQTNGKDLEESIEIQKLYKNEPQTRFYDRYLSNVVDKRLAV